MSLPASKRQDMALGAASGLLAGLVFWWALQNQGATAAPIGLLGSKLSGAWLGVHLLGSVVAGAGFGTLSPYRPQGYASSVSTGVMYALMWWMAGPMTLGPLLEGSAPDWSSVAAVAVFPGLIGHLMYGGLTGLSFHVTSALYQRWFPRSDVGTSFECAPSTRIVILGGGFGGVSTARRLEQLLWRDPGLEITLVSQSNYLLFTPMLAEVAASALEPQHIGCPVRAALPNTRFHRAQVEDIDPERQVVRVRSSGSAETEAMPYDHLVLALGSIPNYFGLPGMEDNAFTLKSLRDATELRNHVISQLEQADTDSDEESRRRRLTFVVVGGGFAGTEMVAELFDLVHSVRRYYPAVPIEELRFVLVHSRDRILPEIGPKLADYALRTLRARGVEFLLETRVAGATAEGVLVGDSMLIPAGTIVWTAGTQPNPLLSLLPSERSRTGALVAEATLQVRGLSNVWAVGDCAQIPDPSGEGRSYPPTAQHAMREGKAAANNIAAALTGRPMKPFRFRSLGMLVPLGHRTGVAEIGGLRFSGLLAWLMWRGVYLSLLPGLEKKVRVLLDWGIDLLFPRDIVLTASSEPETLPQMIQAKPGESGQNTEIHVEPHSGPAA